MRVRSLVTLAALAALALGGAEGALAQEDDDGGGSSDEGALFLLLPVGAKAVGLGRAVTALPGPESVWWNPAGLGAVEESRFVLFRGEDLAGVSTAASLLLARDGLGVLGASYLLWDLGDQDLTDSDGNYLGTLSFRDHVGVLSVATRIWEQVTLGVNLKLVQSRRSCRGQCFEGSGVTATTVAVDAGVQAYGLGDLPLRLGAALIHAGPEFQFENAEQADPLPTRVRFAAGYDLLDAFATMEGLQLWLTTELEDRIREPSDPSTYMGLELVAGTVQSLSLRAGYVFNSVSQVDGAAVGLGLRYESFELGIAKSLAASTLEGDEEPVHVSFGFVF